MSGEETAEEFVSRREFKQELAEVQLLALRLVELSSSDFNQISLDASLRAEIEATRNLKSHSAKRRQLRYLTAVINRSDPASIQKALRVITDGNRAANVKFRSLEKLRDKVASGANDAIELVVAKYPQADRQHLRNLQRNIKKQTNDAAAARASRVLYNYLRDL